MANRWHAEWLKEGVVKWNKRRRKVDFSPDLSGLRFFDLLPPDFRDDPKASRYFEKIDLSKANLSEADLSDLNFRAARFDRADLSHSDMSMSNFDQASFVGTRLVGVDARKSFFEKARFENVTLEGANFSEAGADGAVFVESEVAPEQLDSLGREKIEIYPSRASYRDSKSYHGSISSASEAKAPRQKDDRTVKYKYDVFFGTDRRPVFERGALVDFDGVRADNVSYGVCEVIVPKGHRIGSLGSPLWKRLFNRKDDCLRIDSLIALNKELFYEHIRQSLAQMRNSERPTIFVHGFNNTFQNAVLRAAQIGYDLGIGQGMGLFSWPSLGLKRGYAADEATVESSKYHLAQFIEEFISNIPDGSINIIAHSMGCRCLLGSLEVLSGNGSNALKRINQTILAAADVDVDVMRHIGLHAVSNSSRTTSYVSDEDKALKVSGWLHNYPRVGVMPPTFVLSGMDTVIVNNLDLGGFSHGYVGTSRTILNDIFALLKDNAAPQSRFSIEAHSASGVSCWRLKE